MKSIIFISASQLFFILIEEGYDRILLQEIIFKKHKEIKDLCTNENFIEKYKECKQIQTEKCAVMKKQNFEVAAELRDKEKIAIKELLALALKLSENNIAPLDENIINQQSSALYKFLDILIETEPITSTAT